MRLTALLLLAVAVGSVGTAVAADNTAPLADAGVDQTVVVNSTVYLDANASSDPDGEITSVEWSIETPNGSTLSPDCGDCRRTEFDAGSLGQYTVTLTVTDDDGATRSDTLYVTSTTARGPNVSVTGPDVTAAGENATFTANVSAEDATLQTLTWLVNGSVVERTSLEGASANHSLAHSVDETVPVRAVVYDTLGNRGSATHRVAVDGGGGGGISANTYSECPNQECGADERYTFAGGDSHIIDGDYDGKVKTYIKGQLTSIDTDAPSVKENAGGTYTIEGGAESVDSQHTTDLVINDEGKAVKEPDYPGFGGDSSLPGFSSGSSGSSDDGGLLGGLPGFGGGSDDGESSDGSDDGGSSGDGGLGGGGIFNPPI